MALRYTLREPKLGGFEPEPPFGLYDRGVPLIEIFRLLRGSIDLYDKRCDRLIKITTNETRIGARRSARPTQIYDYLLSPNDGEERASFDDFVRAVERQKHINKEFFERLRADLALCLAAKKTGRNTEAFLYFYRILEHVSLAFPLTYALHESDFVKAHSFLSDLYKNENARDLSAMKTFIPKIAKTGGYESESFAFSFDHASINDAMACMSQLKRCFPVEGGIIVYPDDDSLPMFSVGFISIHSFIIELRNRMFHDRAGERNLDLSQVGGSEILCQVVMAQALHWFSKVYGEIVRTLLERDL